MGYSILHICTGFSLDFQGGITNYVRSIAKTQAINGHKVYVLTDSGKNDEYKVISIESKNQSFSFFKRKDDLMLSEIQQLLFKNKFDLIHIHMMLNIDQRVYEVLKDYKYIVSLHDYWFICPRIQMVKLNEQRCEKCTSKCYECFNVLEKHQSVYRLVRKLTSETFSTYFPIKNRKIYSSWIDNNKKLLENADCLIPVSKRVEEIYRNSGINSKYSVLHIGNLTANDFDYNYIYRPNNCINLVILSNISNIKGGKLICEILKKVNNPLLKVHFFGRASETQKKMMKSAGIIDNGPYNQNELHGILQNMDMGIIVPIWEDNGPQVVMEMLNNHLPVFATKMGGIPDFVNDNNGFLFDPFNECDLQRAIDFLDNLTFDKIARMKASIKPTTSPLEHYHELMELYSNIIDE